MIPPFPANDTAPARNPTAESFLALAVEIATARAPVAEPDTLEEVRRAALASRTLSEV